MRMAEPDNVLSVSQLTRKIRALLEGEFGEVWVEGEISNHRLQSSGHQYFTLKDETAQLSCVLFRGASARMSTPLRDGMAVQVFGELSVYEQRGAYQIIVRAVQPKGLGSLQARFEALKQKLHAEGLFENEYKKPIPRFPRCVALVTSPTGAAIRDMINILTRRAPWLRVLVFPVRVQGQGAEKEIARAIQLLNQAEDIGLPTPDTIVVGRGGGSLEDLWNFNEEIVARSIFASDIPVISAVGHEIDFTISDFVADLRAPTPSAAAELLAPDVTELKRHFDAVKKSIEHRVSVTLEHHEHILDLTAKGTLLREPERQLREAEQLLDETDDNFHRSLEQTWRDLDDDLADKERILARHHPKQLLTDARHRTEIFEHRMTTLMRSRLDECKQRINSMQKLVKSLGPDATLERGFSLTVDAKGKVIVDPQQVRVGDMLITKLAHGRVSSVVTASK
jgi:exodeoxyribonuclease VII large subunit